MPGASLVQSQRPAEETSIKESVTHAVKAFLMDLKGFREHLVSCQHCLWLLPYRPEPGGRGILKCCASASVRLWVSGAHWIGPSAFATCNLLLMLNPATSVL